MHSEELIQYVRAIVAMCNTYSLTSMNNWDGQKVQINKEESIYAPILGAGKKESNNTFSGFLMGDIKEANVTDISPRFTAYHKGVRTFNIDSKTGKVSIGAGNGQIIIDPDANGNVDGCKAVIKSGNYTRPSGGAGMEIDLTDPHIYFGSGKFKVDTDGKLTATEVDISGKITATSGEFNGKITAGEGEVGGWKINTSSLTGGSVTLNKNGLITGGSTHKWHINADGSASFSNLTITGGSINWSSMAGTENVATKSYVTGQGYETAASIKSTVITKDYIETLDIKAGSVDAEKITGTTITGKTISGGTVSGTTISGGSIDIGNGTFIVDGNGKVTCSNLNVTGGEIKLGDAILNANGLTVGSEGGKSTIGNFKVDHNSLYMGTWSSPNTTPNIFIASSNSNKDYIICEQQRHNWAIGAGGSFGVTLDGEMYCKKGKIGGMNIDENGRASASNISLME
jgi:hypothetical protein